MTKTLAKTVKNFAITTGILIAGLNIAENVIGYNKVPHLIEAERKNKQKEKVAEDIVDEYHSKGAFGKSFMLGRYFAAQEYLNNN